MKLRLNNVFLFSLLSLFTSGCAHMSDPCDNKLLKEIPSPDGKLILATYHRECSSKIITMATLEKPTGSTETRGEVVCYITSWGDRHSIEAEWKNDSSILISTTDRLEKFDVAETNESCGAMQISYNTQFRNEQQKSEDPQVVSKIEKALSDVEPCITRVYKSANAADDPAGDVRKMIDNGEHRSAVENILGFSSDAECPVSPATFGMFNELSDTFELKPHYLERVAPFVKK